MFKGDTYRMRLLNIEKLPERDNPMSVVRMMEEDKYRWREQGLTKQEVKDRMLKKLMAAHMCTGSKTYIHAYTLLHSIMNKRSR